MVRARAGDEGARSELIALVYDELRQVATRLMRRERPDHTLPPTAVVHEAVIRLLGEAVFDKAAGPELPVRVGRAGHAGGPHRPREAKGRRPARRWRRRVPLDLVVDYFEEQGLDVVAVHEALDRLAELNERQGQVMTLRYFGGTDRSRGRRGARGVGGHGGARLAAGAGLAPRPARRGGGE